MLVRILLPLLAPLQSLSRYSRPLHRLVSTLRPVAVPGMASIIKHLEIPAEAGGSRVLDSPDLRATPPDKRTWNKAFFNLFWLAAVTNV